MPQDHRKSSFGPSCSPLRERGWLIWVDKALFAVEPDHSTECLSEKQPIPPFWITPSKACIVVPNGRPDSQGEMKQPDRCRWSCGHPRPEVAARSTKVVIGPLPSTYNQSSITDAPREVNMFLIVVLHQLPSTPIRYKKFRMLCLVHTTVDLIGGESQAAIYGRRLRALNSISQWLSN